MVEKGVGYWQLEKTTVASMAVLKILLNRRWHRYQELLEKSKISSATLTKSLKQLEKGIVEKKLDTQSGLYPYPVYYRIRDEYQVFDELLNLPQCTDRQRTNQCISVASMALNNAMTILYSRYNEYKNTEAFRQSRTVALRLYFDYTEEIEKMNSPKKNIA